MGIPLNFNRFSYNRSCSCNNYRRNDDSRNRYGCCRMSCNRTFADDTRNNCRIRNEHLNHTERHSIHRNRRSCCGYDSIRSCVFRNSSDYGTCYSNCYCCRKANLKVRCNRNYNYYTFVYLSFFLKS